MMRSFAFASSSQWQRFLDPPENLKVLFRNSLKLPFASLFTEGVAILRAFTLVTRSTCALLT
eukprot:scaffold2143_cov254-Chaetoceros_neogracile.AAC.4